MKTRRTILAAVVGVMIWAVPAAAQNSPAQVLPQVQVKGEVVQKALPKTGSDVSGEVALGLGLTAAGVGLAVAARRRRASVLTVSS